MKNKKAGMVAMASVMAGAVALNLAAATPINELYEKHVTYYNDFGETAVSNSSTVIDLNGFHGGGELVGGRVSVQLAEGQTILDTTTPSTILFWVKLISRPDPVIDAQQIKREPSTSHMTFQWSGTRRVLMYRMGGAKWGEGTMNTFFEGYNSEGERKTASASYPASVAEWELGEWHLIAAQIMPNQISMSIDGKAFKSVQLPMSLGPLTGWLIWQGCAYEALDEASVLDFKMSDDQIAELYDEYMAVLEEVTIGEETPACALTTESINSGRYGVSVALTNNSATAKTYTFEYLATPSSSQPVTLKETKVVAAGESVEVALDGPIAGEETILADVTVKDENGNIVFRRRRTFAPNSDEPSWMKPQSRMTANFAYYPSANTLHATVDTSCCTNLNGITAIEVSLLSATNGEEVASEQFVASTTGSTEIFWRGMPELNGEYRLRFEALGSGEPVVEDDLVRLRFEWEGNTYGTTAIPEPFREVEVEDEVEGDSGVKKVSVILREHLVDKETGLWRQVTAAGKDILARPMSFISTSNLQPLTFNLSTKSTWDVDGLYDFRLTLSAGHYEPMALEIPIKAERAKLMHACVDGLRSNYGGVIPSGVGSVWNGTMCEGRRSIVGDYVPYLWVGGPLRGIAVFGDNDKGWILGESEKVEVKSEKVGGDSTLQLSTSTSTSTHIPCQEIIREEDGTVVIRLNLIQKAVDLTEAQTIHLGFMATPVKPMLENWREKSNGTLLGGCWYWGGYLDSISPYDCTDLNLRIMGEERETGVLNWDHLYEYTANYPYTETPGTAEWTNSYNTILAHFRNGHYNAAWSKANKTELVFYTNGRGVYYGDPLRQGETFCNEWNRYEYMSRKFTLASHEAYDLDPVASFRDIAGWWYRKMFSLNAGDHLYWDDVYLSSNFDMVLTDAYRLPSGVIQPSSGVFNMRELIKRGAVVQAELGRDPRGNWVHMTNTAVAPICAFAGVHYDWEDIATDTTFQERYTREYIQAVSIGRQMGNRVGIMGYFPTTDTARYNYLAHTGVGVMITHELRWNESGHNEFKLVNAGLKAWGYCSSATQVWNYWDEDVEFPVEVKGVTASSIAIAKAEKGEAMICVSSFDSTNGVLKVKPDLIAMGFAKGPWTASLMTTNSTGIVEKEAITVTDDEMTLNLPAFDWALIKITAPRKVAPVDVTSLPEGYDELVEFVDADSAQWFDTGIKVNPQHTGITARFSPLEALPTGSALNDTRLLFGVNGTADKLIDSKNYNAVLLRGSDRKNFSEYHICPVWIGGDGGGYHYPNAGSYIPGKTFELSYGLSEEGKARAVINKSEKRGGYYTRYDGELEHNLFIGDINNAGTGLFSEATNSYHRTAVRWFEIKITDQNGEKIAWFRPAKKDGVFGFYEAVSNRFFVSRGDAAFIGPEYAVWNEGAIPEAGKVAVIPAGAERKVSYQEVAVLNELKGIKMLGDDSALTFTNGNISSVQLYTSIFGHGRVMNYESGPDTSSSCALQIHSDNSGFDGVFVASNAATSAVFAPYAFGTTNKVIIDTAKGHTLDRRRFALDSTIYNNEFHFIRADNMFIGYAKPEIASTFYLDAPGGVTFHGNSSGLIFSGKIVTTVTNETSTVYLNGNIILSGGESAVKDFAKKHVQGGNPVTIGAPMRFKEQTYSPVIYNNCNYSWNGESTTTFAMTNVFEDSVFLLCNYAKANDNQKAATLDLNGYDQVVGTLGVYTAAGFNPAAHYNTNMVITSSKPAVLTIRRTCRNDNAANVFHGRLTGAVSLCLDSTLEIAGAIRFCAPGIETTGALELKRGTAKFDETADGAKFGSIIFGAEGKLEIASNTTIYAETAYRGTRPMNPGARTYGAGTLVIKNRPYPLPAMTIYLR